MAEKLLNRTDIIPLFLQMGAKRMAVAKYVKSLEGPYTPYPAFRRRSLYSSLNQGPDVKEARPGLDPGEGR